MSERATALAAAFHSANAAFIAAIAAFTEPQWRTVCAPEGWSVGVVAQHVGLGTATIARHIRDFPAEEPPEPETVESVHQRNAVDAARASPPAPRQRRRLACVAPAQKPRAWSAGSPTHSSIAAGCSWLASASGTWPGLLASSWNICRSTAPGSARRCEEAP